MQLPGYFGVQGENAPRGVDELSERAAWDKTCRVYVVANGGEDEGFYGKDCIEPIRRPCDALERTEPVCGELEGGRPSPELSPGYKRGYGYEIPHTEKTLGQGVLRNCHPVGH